MFNVHFQGPNGAEQGFLAARRGRKRGKRHDLGSERSAEHLRYIAQPWFQTFENERNRRAKRHFDEFCQDERLADAESYFKVNVFNACLDIIISQLSLRFSALRTVANLFRMVQPHILATEEKNAIYEGAQRLV